MNYLALILDACSPVHLCYSIFFQRKRVISFLFPFAFLWIRDCVVQEDGIFCYNVLFFFLQFHAILISSSWSSSIYSFRWLLSLYWQEEKSDQDVELIRSVCWRNQNLFVMTVSVSVRKGSFSRGTRVELMVSNKCLGCLLFPRYLVVVLVHEIFVESLGLVLISVCISWQRLGSQRLRPTLRSFPSWLSWESCSLGCVLPLTCLAGKFCSNICSLFLFILDLIGLNILRHKRGSP